MWRLVLSCEHAGNRVPAVYRQLFRRADDVLASHRGWDPGSLSIARSLERRLMAPLFVQTVTRLLVEPNRSIGHRRLFSEFTSELNTASKQAILRGYYYPHRDRIEAWISNAIRQGERVVHVSVHTFTPQLAGQVRKADVGLLYDPTRTSEKQLCDMWKVAIAEPAPALRVRRNYPYSGKADGLTRHFRHRYPESSYAGIELEVNQKWVDASARWRRLHRELALSLADSLVALNAPHLAETLRDSETGKAR